MTTDRKRPLEGQRALVTGGSSGIGAAVALALGRAGAHVAVNYAGSQDGARKVVAEIEAAGGKALAVQADVSREGDVQRMFSESLAALGRLDILVNNAGIQKDAALVDMTVEQWNAVIGVNLTGAFLCCRAAARQFLAQEAMGPSARGKILCISSVHDVIPWAGHVNYASSKGGVAMLMKTLAQELAPHRIRVNSISPGAIRTPINRAAWETKEALTELLTLIPYGRIGEPDDIGKAATWIVSDEADYITGATLYVDGGMTLYPGFADNG